MRKPKIRLLRDASAARKPKIRLRGLPIINNEAAKARIYARTCKTKKAVCSLLDYYTQQRKGTKAENVICLN